MRDLEARYPDTLVGIGVHSGKFIAERSTANIRTACQRLAVDHPVVNDRQFRIWRAYAVRAWPTIVLIDPAGHVVFSRAGELTTEMLAPLVDVLISEAERDGTLVSGPFALHEHRKQPESGLLRFPGKVLAAGRRLFISDTAQHRILQTELAADGQSGRVVRTIGAGVAGYEDGPAETARFREPQGLALWGERLLVADRDNHSVRGIDLESGAVSTVAGTGRRARSRNDAGLRSPWDLLVYDDTLYIAMAGSHQIWALDLGSGALRTHAGSGVEDIFDAPLSRAALAQPSGLTVDDSGRLYFADSESSGVRWADIELGGEVGTLVGTGLFDFGDKDGAGDDVRLQHPLGVEWHEGRLVVADTYNHKLKLIDPGTRTCATWLGTGEPGHVDGEAPLFHEPSGISASGALLYVADTNSHAIRVVDTGTRVVSTLELST